MKNLLLLLITMTGAFLTAQSQSLPANTCGIVYSYDAAGNRTQRKYVCNNSLGAYSNSVVTLQNPNISDIRLSTTLYPNPTTGRFTIVFTRPLNAAKGTIFDTEGRLIQSQTLTGNEFGFDISSFSAGIYSIRVLDGTKSYIFKVVRQ